jgi:hypothetical protein
MNSKRRCLMVPLILGLGSMLALIWTFGVGTASVVEAQPQTGIHRVATSGNDAPGCGSAASPCRTIQYTVDLAQPGDEIHVATGVYDDVHARMTFAGYPGPGFPGPSVVTQVVYISKTLTLQGGYSTANAFADPPDPASNPTTLDAGGLGRVVAVFGDPTADPGQMISPTVSGFRITGGDAAGLGGGPTPAIDAAGGVGIIGAAATLIDCQVYSNTAVVAGGVGAGYSPARLIGNTIFSNTAGYDGGGVGLSSSPATLIGNDILSNISGHDGGGVVTTGCDGVTMVGNWVSQNIAYAGGGGIYMDTTSAEMTANVISANSSVDISGGEGGGGVYLWESQLNITGTTIISNTATWYGGGLYAGGTDNGSVVDLVNCVVADNRADVDGSGLYIESSHLIARYATIAHNMGGYPAEGLAVTSYLGSSSTAALTNTIVVSHEVGIRVGDGCTTTMEATLWGAGPWANDTDWLVQGNLVTGTINVQGDPDFVNPDLHDYHIGPGSAAIDAGVDAGVRIDIDGEPRPGGAGYDLGADEFYYRIIFPLIYRNY